MSVLFTNLLPNPSFEDATARWTISAGFARAASDGSYTGDRSWCMAYQTSSGGSTWSVRMGQSGNGIGVNAIPVSPSAAYSASIEACLVSSAAGLTSFRLQIIEYDSSGTAVVTSNPMIQASPAAGTKYRLTGTITTGATTAYLAVVGFGTSGPSLGAAVDCRFDKFMLVAGSTVPSIYFDGARANSAWSSTADQSTSTWYTADATSSLTSSNSLSATASASYAGSTNLTSSSNVTSGGQLTLGGSFDGSIQSLISASGQKQGLAQSSLSSSGSVVGNGQGVYSSSVSCSAQGGLNVAATQVFGGIARLSGLSDGTFVCVNQINGSSNLQSITTISGTPYVIYPPWPGHVIPSDPGHLTIS